MEHQESQDSLKIASPTQQAFSLSQDKSSEQFTLVFSVLWMLVVLLATIVVEG